MPLHVQFLFLFFIIYLPNILLMVLHPEIPIVTFFGLLVLLLFSITFLIIYSIIILPIKEFKLKIDTILPKNIFLYKNKKRNELYELDSAIIELITQYKDCNNSFNKYKNIQNKKEKKFNNFIKRIKEIEEETKKNIEQYENIIQDTYILYQQLYITIIEIFNGISKIGIPIKKQYLKLHNSEDIKLSIPVLTAFTKNLYTVCKETEAINTFSTKSAQAVLETMKYNDTIKTNFLHTKKYIQPLYEKTKNLISMAEDLNKFTEQTNTITFHAVVDAARSETAQNSSPILAHKIKAITEKMHSTVKELTMTIKEIHTQSHKTVNPLENITTAIAYGSNSITNAGISIHTLSKKINTIKTNTYSMQNTTIEHLQKYKNVQQIINDITMYNVKASFNLEALTKKLVTATKLIEKIGITIQNTPNKNINKALQKQTTTHNQPTLAIGISIIDNFYQNLWGILHTFYTLIAQQKDIPTLKEMLLVIQSSFAHVIQIEQIYITSQNIFIEKNTYSNYAQQVKKILQHLDDVLHLKNKNITLETLEKLKNIITCHITYISQQYKKKDIKNTNALTV